MRGFKNNLYETSLTFGEITRDDRPFRVDLFLRKYKSNEPFELTSGDEVVLKYNSDIENAIIKKDSKKATSVGLETIDGQKIPFSKLKKSKEFGGGRGTGGGSANTRATESSQCIYLQAIWDNPNTTFSPNDIRTAYPKCHVDASLNEVMLEDDIWITSSIRSAQILYKVLKKKTYSFHRGSGWVSILEKKFQELNSKDKSFANINKWTPADIWLIAKGAENKYNIEGAESLQFLNNELLRAYAERDIIGVSLKRVTGKPKLTQVNFRVPFKPPVFKSVSYGKTNFFASKDGYIFFGNGGQMQFRTFPTFQCEIIGKSAKHGKIGHGGIDAALYATIRDKTDNRKQLESSIKKDRESFLKKFYGFYDSAVSNPVNYETFVKELENKNVEWLVSKFYVTSIFVMIKGREQQFMEYLYRVAKSQSPMSAVHLKVQ